MIKLLLSLLLFATLAFSHEIKYDENATGKVRHLKIYKHPLWVAEIELHNEKKVLFSSPKGMFEFYLHPGGWYSQYHIKSENDFKKLYVTDFQTSKIIDAKGAFFVYGSDVLSPAGDDLIPFESYKAAQEFSKKHHGSRVFGFKDISYGLIKYLNGAV